MVGKHRLFNNIKGVLLDIEGTTSSISFVYDKMFPYVRRVLTSFLESNWDEEGVTQAVEMLALDLGHADASGWLGGHDIDQQRQFVDAAIIKLMDDDVKATGLKQLQGLIWKDGFHSGELVAHVYEDVAPAIKHWIHTGIDVRIYSSGSISAQKLFFGHTIAGNLLDDFSGHYDTTTGGKKEPESYRKITAQFDLPADAILFVSDVPEELQAAEAAGLQTCLSVRPGNKATAEDWMGTSVTSFEQLAIA